MENICVCFVLLVCVGLTIGVDVYVYNYQKYDFTRTKQATVPKPTSLFTFGYNQGDNIAIDVFLKNKNPNMTAAVYSMQPSDNNMNRTNSKIYMQDQKYYFMIRGTLDNNNISIEIELKTTIGLGTREIIAQGEEGTKYNRNCVNTDRCMIEVDLRNIEDDGNGLVAGFEPVTPNYGNAETTPNFNDTSEDLQPLSSSLSAVLTYAIPSAIVMCVLLLVTCLVVKKCCHRNSPPVETIQLNTYSANGNEVIYADLALAHEGSQPPSRDEESPYAKIAGVLNPNKK